MNDQRPAPGATLTIQRAVPSDEQDVLGLVDRLVEFGPPPWRDARNMVQIDRKLVAEAMHAAGTDPLVLVARLSDKVAGFVHLHSLTDHYRTQPHGHVSDLVVARAFEGHGVGHRLINAAQAWAMDQGYDMLTISVFATNRRAIELYERAGFGSDILRLVKSLVPNRSEPHT